MPHIHFGKFVFITHQVPSGFAIPWENFGGQNLSHQRRKFLANLTNGTASCSDRKNTGEEDVNILIKRAMRMGEWVPR